jgi:hypothetical protein
VTPALVVLLILGAMGAFDTLVFHEWIGRLPSNPRAHRELRLHAARDAVYAFLFATLAWLEPRGAIVALYATLFLVEIVITLSDFVIEDHTRPLPAGERVTHALMGIVYGILLALLAPSFVTWYGAPTAFVPAGHGLLSWALTAFALGVAISGVRDVAAASSRSPRVKNTPYAP